jgi:hypothetical protein
LVGQLQRDRLDSDRPHGSPHRERRRCLDGPWCDKVEDVRSTITQIFILDEGTRELEDLSLAKVSKIELMNYDSV